MTASDLNEDLGSSADADTQPGKSEGGSPAHTPGPWRLFTARGGQVLVGIGDTDGGGITDGGFGTWRSGKEQMANARLIAAAPCMALTLAEIACKAELAANACDDEGRASGFRIIAADARAAIAKAVSQ